MSVEVLHGDAREVLPTMPAGRVHCCVTSPPYWGLRNYKLRPVRWPDGWRGSLGLEPTPGDYVRHLVGIMEQVKRVLRDDGTLWLNMGDCFLSAKGSCFNPGGGDTSYSRHRELRGVGAYSLKRPNLSDARAMGLRPKNLLGMPWRVAFAMQDAGWILRSAIVWAKGLSFCESYSGSVMPESVRDRPTSAYEMVFMFSKQERYFYDWFAAREPSSTTSHGGGQAHAGRYQAASGRGDSNLAMGIVPESGARNWRNVWILKRRPAKERHFAMFPGQLAETAIIAATSPYVCAECSAPWARILDKQRLSDRPGRLERTSGDSLPNAHGPDGRAGNRHTLGAAQLGWQTTCGHPCRAPGRALVLDPFAGLGNAGLAADLLGRDAVLIELSGKYCRRARERIAADYTREPLMDADGRTCPPAGRRGSRRMRRG